MSSPAAIVLGLRENGLGVVRALGRAGVEVIGVDDDVSRPAARSRYGRRVASPGFLDAGLVETLEEIASGQPRPPVVIATMDQNVTILSSHRERVDRCVVHSLPAPDVVRRLTDKSLIREYAEQRGFSLPATFELADRGGLEECVARVGLPAILKPRLKNDVFRRFTPEKAFFVRTPEELRRVYDQVSQWEREAVVQEWIPGPDRNLVFGLFYLDEQGEPLGGFVGRKIRQCIPRCGTACSAEPFEDPQLESDARIFFGGLEYRGFAALEFKIDERDGRRYLIEPSVGRTEHLFTLAVANGVNLPLLGYRHMAGEPLPEPRPGARRCSYLNWRRDLRAARRYIRDGELGWRDWLRDLRGWKQYPLFSWSDPGPWLRDVVRRARSKASSVVRRARQSARVIRERHLAPRLTTPPEPPGGPRRDARAHLEAALGWLCRAQDAVEGGGVARAYGLAENPPFPAGWQPAYPETTGYIIPTFYDAARELDLPDLRERASRMAAWLLSVRTPDGGIPGGVVGESPLPVVFNTGQVLLGWCRAWEETREDRYLDAVRSAARFLVDCQDDSGAFRRFTARNGREVVHAYDVRSAWALLRAWQVTGEDRLREAAERNLLFTAGLQSSSGWFRSNGLRPKGDQHPLTHTIAYTTRGFLESARILERPDLLEIARRTADALRERVSPGGYLAGEFLSSWRPAAAWSCLTGSVQMAVIWWRLAEETGDARYAEVALRVDDYVRATQTLDAADPGVRGGVAGSYPAAARYGRHQMLNWAAKFLVDALLLELRIRPSGGGSAGASRVSTLTVGGAP